MSIILQEKNKILSMSKRLKSRNVHPVSGVHPLDLFDDDAPVKMQGMMRDEE